jgi:hypothetical protein
MKKFIPYIIIVVLIYLTFGFIKMQFNPIYLEEHVRGTFVLTAIVGIVLYFIKEKSDNL